MTDAQKTCSQCGGPLDPGSQFCGGCGKPTPTAEPAAVPAPAAPDAPKGGAMMNKTMMGISPLIAPPTAPTPRATDPGDDAIRPSTDAAADDDEPPLSREERERSTATGMTALPRGQMGRTMLGLPMHRPTGAPMPKVIDPEPQAEPSGPVSSPLNKTLKTMFGMSGPGMPRASAPGAGGRQGEPAAEPKTGPRGGGIPKGTLMGGPDMMAPLAPSSDEPTTASRQRPPAPAAPNHTLMSLEQADEPEDAMIIPGTDRGDPTDPPAHTQHRSYNQPSTDPPSWQRSDAPKPPRSGSTLAALVVFGLLLIAAGVLGYFALAPRAPDVRVHVVTENGRDRLQFELPGAQPGAKIRFGGQEQAVQAGRASFSLAADAIRVGENVVLFDVLEPDGNVEPGRIALSVDYRVTVDTAPLRAGKPSVDVVVAARPGSKVFLDSQPVALDAQGRGVRSDPLELSSAPSGSIEHVVRYRVEPASGEPTVGELRTTLVLTSLRIDRPGAELVTDRAAVEIAGETEANATVTIDGQNVPVTAGRFVASFPLPAVGVHKPTVMAMVEGKAPRALTLNLVRVDDLAKAAEGFSYDASLGYAKIAQNPAIYSGQKAMLEGRVYNVTVEGGHSSLQLLVKQCPASQRCPLWVSYPAATELTVDKWVRVLGTLDGEQQFRSETNELRSVPKIEAAFLVPIEP